MAKMADNVESFNYRGSARTESKRVRAKKRERGSEIEKERGRHQGRGRECTTGGGVCLSAKVYAKTQKQDGSASRGN